MSMSRKKEKAAAQKKETTRQLIGINDISDYGLKTSRGMLAFFSVKPTNLSVQPPEAVGGRIYALMTVLKGQTEIEMLALNSKESFEDNKRYYRERAAMEELPVISRLLEADARSLDRLQVQMATAREFFVLIRFRDDQDADFRTQLSRVQKSLEDQGFKVRLAGKEDAKRKLNQLAWQADEDTILDWADTEGYPIEGTIDPDGQYSKLDISEHTRYDTQSLAKFAFSMFWRAMRFAEEQQVPILLDY